MTTAGQPFLVASMFTADVASLADRLRASLEAVGLTHHLEQVPTVHVSLSAKGSSDIEYCKPAFIHRLIERTGKPILFVDADTVFRSRPDLFFDIDAAFACYNWLADRATDAYKPLDARYYRFSHAVDLFDPTQLITSGAVMYFSPAGKALLNAWTRGITKHPGVAEDQTLDYVYNFSPAKPKTHWLGKEYCRYLWWISVKPVIDHPQMSAIVTPDRDFSTVTGKTRHREVRNILPPQGPFPRDCLIDIKTKTLLRPAPYSVLPMPVGRFTTDLWLSSPNPGQPN